jgi:predicted enzyme related to lactoylglutathione lyase
MAAQLGLVLDCADPERLATFWSEAIGYTTLGGAGNYVVLVDEAGQQPKLLLQQVSEPKTGKNRVHFDIETPTVDEEVSRLEGLGARRLGTDAIEEHGTRWVVMADPEGNEFCVCNGGQPHSD